ncbi:MAG: dihydroxy-acid dehydratase, partial [Xanthobacteraceae bacterium]
PSGLPNQNKAKVRQLYAEGKVGRDALLEAESQAYHAPGTCTFYGTANSNQMLMEVMGLHMPGTAFVPPNTPVRDALTAAAAKRVLELTALGDSYTPVGRVVDERAIANGIVGLLATGGSTNHTIHLVAIAYAAGIRINWDDFHDLSAVVPLLAKIYPNGADDVNDFHHAGGMGFLVSELMDAGLLHPDTLTVAGGGLAPYRQEPYLDEGELRWRPAPAETRDERVLRPISRPFAPDGGLKLLEGNLGRAVIKTSAVRPDRHVVEAPAIIFNSQEELMAAFDRGELRRDFVAVVRFQGPQANGMPELHKLTPPLGVLQDEGFRVALVTDGRMSGASGKVPAAIHVTPECLAGGALAKVRSGDVIRLDATRGTLEVQVGAEELAARPDEEVDLTAAHFGLGRELFANFRANAVSAEEGAMTWLPPHERAMPVRTDAKAPRVHDHFVYDPDVMPSGAGR